jgi:hypothetical protein
VSLQSVRLLCDSAIAATGIPYKLVQQSRSNWRSKVEGEALLTRFAIHNLASMSRFGEEVMPAFRS